MKVNPYLNFPGNTEEAFGFYSDVFGQEIVHLMRFGDFPDNPMGMPEHEMDRIAHIALPVGDALLMGTDVPESWHRPITMGNNFYITLEPESAQEAKRLFDILSDGGSVEMELQPTDWALLYGTLADRYGVQWMISYGDPTAG